MNTLVSPRPGNRFADLKVLVLEDHPFQRSLLVNVLKSFGIKKIAGAADGLSGLSALNSERDGFDVAICDLKMEGMDGIEFIRHAASRQVGSFIVTSALEGGILSSAETIVRGFGASLTGTLKKPIDILRLKAMLADCLHRKGGDEREGNTRPEAIPSKSDIIDALRREEFIPFFQPKIDLRTNLPIGVEMLARWQHPSKGILSPAAFVPFMEREQLIDALGDCLFRQSMTCAAEWADCGWEINLAVNLSPLTLQNTDVPARLGRLVKESGIFPEQVTIEVTETAVSENVQGLLESLTRLRMQGFELAVDDFGTGYSSLLQLSEMPFTEIKIDRGFVSSALANRKSAAIVESIVQLAQKLEMRTVAEGIESLQELDYIRTLGCTAGQGYYLGRPLGQQALLQYLAGMMN